MKNYTPVNYEQPLGSYTNNQPFRFWCQKVLPLVYDDSLSYYELLCKVVDYLNKTMEDVNTAVGDVTNLHSAYTQLQAFVNNYFENLDVQEEINNKLDELVESGRLDLLLQTFVPYVTPMMFGAKGDGVTDDSSAIQACFNSGKNVIMGKYTYLCNSQIIANHVSIDGYGATLNFANFTGTHAVYINSNTTKIRGLTISNANKNSGYALYLLYVANHGLYKDITITNSTNGIYLSGSWYNAFDNIYIACTRGLTDNKCFTIGDAYNANPANGEQFSNIFLQGGAYGLYFEGAITVNSLQFNGVCIEHQTSYGVYGEKARGNVEFNGLYYEDCALTNSDSPLIYTPSLTVSISNLLIRGTYPSTGITAFTCANYMVYQPVYNPSSISIPHINISGINPPAQFNQLYANFGYGLLQSMTNYTLTSYSEPTIIKYYLRVTSDHVLKITNIGAYYNDTTNRFCDIIYAYVYTDSGGVRVRTLATNIPYQADFSKTYNFSVTSGYDSTHNSIAYTITMTNTNSSYANYRITTIIDIQSSSQNSIRGVEQ